MMKIVADENIPYARELFSQLGELHLLPGRHLRADDVVDADVLLVRSVTSVNEKLLNNSTVKFVGTCTIGVDHLDSAYLQRHDIQYASAPGCNALAVVQYVLAALATINRLQSSQKAVVVGGGNVGSRVFEHLQYLGMQSLCVDPFIDANESEMKMASFEAVYDADIICLHTPLTHDGEHPTHHLFHEKVLSQLKPNAVLINAGRGAVVDNSALLDVLQSRSDLSVILDVWEKEPDINSQLLRQVALGTPHIAGYSFEGRVTGSIMIFEALSRFLNIDGEVTQRQIAKIKKQAFGAPLPVCVKSLHAAILNSYLLSEDHKALIEVMNDLPHAFDRLRKYYPQRREFSHFHIYDANAEISQQLKQLGFIVDE